MTAARLAVAIVALVFLGPACSKTRRGPSPSPAPTSAANPPPDGFCPPGAQYVGGRPPAKHHEWCVVDGVEHGPATRYWSDTGEVLRREWYDHGELMRRLSYGKRQSIPDAEENYSGTRRRERFWRVEADAAIELLSDKSYLGDKPHGRWMEKAWGKTSLDCYEQGISHWHASLMMLDGDAFVRLEVNGNDVRPPPPWAAVEKRECPFQFEFPVPR